MKHSRKALRATFALALAAVDADARRGREEVERSDKAIFALFKGVTLQPAFADLEKAELDAIFMPAQRELEKAAPGAAIATFAPRVPPDLAEVAYELACWAVLGDELLVVATEGDYLTRLGGALGLSDERTGPIAKRVLRDRKAMDMGHIVEERSPEAAEAHKNVLKAIVSLAYAALRLTDEAGDDELLDLVARLASHPLFDAMPGWRFQAILSEAIREAKDISTPFAVSAFAPLVPPDHAEAALELTLWAMFADGSFDPKSEGAYLDDLSAALGLANERGQEVCKRVLDERKAVRRDPKS